MNKTKIEWCDYTLNPIVGCPHNCPYCYARKQAKRQKQRCELCYQFIPHPHLERLNQLTSTQKPSKIFIDSMWDWNGPGVRQDWLIPIIRKMNECPQHTFQILSKRPEGYDRFDFPTNVWLGTSISTIRDCHRVRDLYDLNTSHIKFVSIEPIHEKIEFCFFRGELDWLIVGAETGHRKGKIKPKEEWISCLIKNARSEGIALFIKENVHWPDKIQEFPVGF